MHIVQQNKQNPSISFEKLENLRDFYYANEKKSYEVCVQMAVNMFWECFYYQIENLLNAFPANAVDKETGKPFWSGEKRAPSVIPLDLNDRLHLELIQATSNILAVVFGLKAEQRPEIVKEIASKLAPIRSKRVKKVTFNEKSNEEEENSFSQDDAESVKKLYDELINVPVNDSRKPYPVEFEKDDPSNWHI